MNCRILLKLSLTGKSIQLIPCLFFRRSNSEIFKNKIWFPLIITMLFDAFHINAEDATPLYSNEFLFRIKPVASKSAQKDFFEKIESQVTGSILKPIFHERPRGASKKSIDTGLERWYSLSLPVGTDPEQIIEQLNLSHIIDVSQPNFLRQPATLNIDSLRSSQWNLRLIGWSDKSSLASEIVVAIVDSGVDYEHPDLAGNIWTNLSELNGIKDVDDDHNGYVDDIVGWDFSDAPSMFGIGDYTSRDADPSDESGHGTHVAGIIAAISNNRSGISGIAPNAKLMVLRAGFNTPTGTYLADDDLAAAISTKHQILANGSIDLWLLARSSNFKLSVPSLGVYFSSGYL